jgi:hypothetical protein
MRKNYGKWILCPGFALVLAFTVVSTVYARVAVINNIKGSVEIQKAGVTEWKPAAVRDELYINEKVQTRKGAMCEILLDDGSILKLKENTMLEINDLSEDPETKKKSSIFKLLLGKLWAKAAPQGDSKFNVVTPTAIAGVRGTEFAIIVEINGSSEILVFEGSIDVKTLREEIGEMRTILVEAGKALGVNINVEVGSPRDLTPGEQKEWKNAAQSTGKNPVNIIVFTLEEKKAFKKEIDSIKGDIEENRLAGLNTKKNDFAAGRTLRNHAGVLCRTEQAVFRPTNDSIRILNMTMIGEASPNHLNYVEGTLRFNGALSADIMQVAKDIVSEKVDLVGTRIEVANAARSIGDANRDVFVADYDILSDNGSMTYNNVPIEIGQSRVITGFSDNSFSSETKFGLKENSVDLGNHLYVSNWIINNEGKVLGKTDFSDNPGQMLNMLRNNVAFEFRFDFSELNATIKGGKMDVIFIPDIVFQMIDMALREAGNMGINIDFSDMNNSSNH